MIDGTHFTRTGLGIRIAKEAIRGKWHAIAQPAAQDIAHGDAPSLSQNIQAGEFERGQHLSSIVVPRCGWIRDEESHFLQACGIVSYQIRLDCPEYEFGGFAAPTHFAEPD